MSINIDNVPDDNGQLGANYGKDKKSSSVEKPSTRVYMTKEQARSVKVGDKVKLVLTGEVCRVGEGYGPAEIGSGDKEPPFYEAEIDDNNVEDIQINSADKALESMMGKSK